MQGLIRWKVFEVELHGKNLIGSHTSATGKVTILAYDPRQGKTLSPPFSAATQGEIHRALELAEKAAPKFRMQSPKETAAFLETIAKELGSLKDGLIERAALETGLTVDRLKSELARTLNQYIDNLHSLPGVHMTSLNAVADPDKTEALPTLLETNAAAFTAHEALRQEVFGPSTVIAKSERCEKINKAGHPEPVRSTSNGPERSEGAQGKLREGSKHFVFSKCRDASLRSA